VRASGRVRADRSSIARRSPPCPRRTAERSPARPRRPTSSRRAHHHSRRSRTARRARCGRIPLLIVDEVGYIPFDPEAAALFLALISSRYERRSLIVSSNKTFSAWAEIFGDPVAVAAMVDRLVHHAEVIVLKGDSFRLRGKRQEVLTGEKER